MTHKQTLRNSWRITAAIVIVAATTVHTGPGTAVAMSGGDVAVSGAVYAPSSLSSCAGSSGGAAGIRGNVDLLDDSWRAMSTGSGLAQFETMTLPVGDPVATHPTTGTFGASGIVANVSLRNVAPSTILGFGGTANDPSKGSLATVNSNGPSVGVGSSRTLQECAPYPASHYGTSSATQTPFWNENAGDGTTLNGVLFEFSAPIRSFGAWFGDLESRAGTPAWMKLFNAGGTVIWESPVGGEVADDTQCGGTGDTDVLACGNQGTRWVGFVAPAGENVSSMLVTVGDDDSCAQVAAAQCGGGTEHLSFVGATLGVNDQNVPDPTTTTTTSTTTTSTTVVDISTTTTSTLVDESTTTSSTTIVDDTTTTTDNTTTSTTVADSTTTTENTTTTSTTVPVDESTTTTTDNSTTTTSTLVDDSTTTTSTTSTTTTVPEESTTTTSTTVDVSTTVPDSTSSTSTTVAGTTTTTDASASGLPTSVPATTTTVASNQNGTPNLPVIGGNPSPVLRIAGLITAAGLLMSCKTKERASTVVRKRL